MYTNYLMKQNRFLMKRRLLLFQRKSLSAFLPDVTDLSINSLLLRASINGILHEDSGIRLSLYKPIEIIRIFPPLGDVRGGTIVSVLIKQNAYPSSVNAVCSFGADNVKPALKFTGSKITCKAPAGAVSSITLGVSINGIDFHYSKSPYAYVAETTLSHLEPSSGTSYGGTGISIYGTGFQNVSTLFCRIGKTVLEAVYMSSTVVRCSTPFFSTTVSKEVPVKVSNNGQEWTQSTLTFQYIPLLHLVSVKPSHGPLEGQTVLKILVSGMSRLDLNDLSCQLGNKTVPATVINLAEIRCVTPAVNASGAVALSVVRYGEEITNTKLKFFYRNDAAVLSVTPNHATERGGEVATIIFREMPQELRGVKCHFGDAEVEAFKITPMSIKCNVPQLPPGEYGLSISINGIHYTRQQTPFFISPAIRLNTLDPNSGPVNGGTIVSIGGTGFLMHQTVYCRFGNSIVVGFVRSSEKIQCKTPPQASTGEVYVEISVGDNVAFLQVH